MNLPPSWPRMTRHNKALYLVNTYQAKNYHAAQKMLGSRHSPKPPTLVKKETELWYQKD